MERQESVGLLRYFPWLYKPKENKNDSAILTALLLFIFNEQGPVYIQGLVLSTKILRSEKFSEKVRKF
jgi:hypothetical protein